MVLHPSQLFCVIPMFTIDSIPVGVLVVPVCTTECGACDTHAYH